MAPILRWGFEITNLDMSNSVPISRSWELYLVFFYLILVLASSFTDLGSGIFLWKYFTELTVATVIYYG